MKSIIYLLLCCVQINCYPLSGDQNNQDDKREDSDLKRKHPFLDKEDKKPTDYDKITSINVDFAFRFYNQIISGTADKNVFLSPLGISTAFAMLALGAKSETQVQLLKGLGVNLSEIKEEEIHEGFHYLLHNRPYAKSEVTMWTEPEVNIGNALFVEENLKPLPEFSKGIKALYEAESFSCNFSNYIEAEEQINDYIMNKTGGKIPHSVDRLDQTTVMVLVNYITFKADWKLAFDTASITEEDFFVDANRTVKVNLMSQEGYYKYLRDDVLSSWVVEIDFRGDGIAETYRDDITALFILPDEGKMKYLEGALLKESISKWVTFFRTSAYENLHLSIPKFTISSSYDLKDIMEKLGVTDIFNNDADLSGINGERNLKVSKIVHKAVLDIRESGTEEEKVTTLWSWPVFHLVSSTPIIKFNKPYMMVILDKRINIIFLAKMVDPTEGGT
ncbi:alpha-1-antitrypsin [Pogona vitticeps]